MAAPDIPAYIDQQRRWIDSELDRHMPDDHTRPDTLHTAMRYGVFSGGKRIRPILGLAAQSVFRAPDNQTLLPLLAVELFHSYTLIHDDLPAMDDDDLRRGQPTVHIAFGEGMAILVGDALLTLAFEWLAACPAPPPWLPGQYGLELAEAGGHRGVIAGQVEDLDATPMVDHAAERVDYIHLHKTAALIRAAIRIGALAGGADQAALEALTLFGCKLGLAFQVIDDLLDATEDTATIGKPAGSDDRNRKLTYVSVHGIDGARQRAATLIDEALTAIADLPNTETLAGLAEFCLRRTA